MSANNNTNVNEIQASSLPDIRSLSHSELKQAVESAGQPPFRVNQLEEWLWKRNVGSFDEMTNLSKAFRETLASSFSIFRPLQQFRQDSLDGSRKYLLGLSDGTEVECVGLPSGSKLTVCVSSQAGCAMGCAFCATGAAGLRRSLKAHEIYQQVMHVQNDYALRVSNVVFMGQGEPFANYDASLAALRLLNSPKGTNIGARHLTVSTCGVIPMIARFVNEPEQFTLAVSLHSAVQETRNHLMPGVKRWSLVHLWSMMGEYVEKTGRRPSYEYALMGGVNDTDAELKALCNFCEGTLAHVNLIQLNKVEGSPFVPSTPERAQDFVRALARVGVEASIRASRGQDIDAACGQLAQKQSRKPYN